MVKDEVRNPIPERKITDDALRKRMERSRKAYKPFNAIVKEKIGRIIFFSPSSILNLTLNDIDHVIAEILTGNIQLY